MVISLAVDDLADLVDSQGVVEIEVGLVSVLGELDKLLVLGVHAGSVDGTEVLESALDGEEGPDQRESHLGVLALQRQLVPDTFHLGVVQVADLQVLVQTGSQRGVYLFQVVQELLEEEDLDRREEGGVVSKVDGFLVREVLISEIHGLGVDGSGEVREDGRHAPHREPQRPVYFRDVELVDLAVIFEECPELSSGDALVLEVRDVETEEGDHLVVRDERSQVRDEEVALFIGDGGERVVRVVVLQVRL